MQSFIQRVLILFSLVALTSHAFGQTGVSPVAGTGTAGFSGDGGAATSATLNDPTDIAVDSNGNLLNHPFATAVDTSDNFFIGDFGGSATTSFSPLYIPEEQNTSNSRIHMVNRVSGTVLPGDLLFTYNMPQVLNPTEQTPIQVALASAVPVSVTGTLTLTFTPNATKPADDPNVTMVNGDASARNSNVTFPSNTLNANLSLSNGVLQAGTVAGTIELSVTNVQEGGVGVTPGNSTFDIQVPRRPPVITGVRVLNVTSAGFVVEITGYSTTRDIGSAKFDFGAATGQKLLTLELKPDVTSAFTTYYQSPASDATGSAFVYTQPFSIEQGTVNAVASVTVALTNSAGASQLQAAQMH
jgi:hypothetical protein